MSDAPKITEYPPLPCPRCLTPAHSRGNGIHSIFCRVCGTEFCPFTGQSEDRERPRNCYGEPS